MKRKARISIVAWIVVAFWVSICVSFAFWRSYEHACAMERAQHEADLRLRNSILEMQMREQARQDWQDPRL